MLVAEIAGGWCHDGALRDEKLTSRLNRQADVFLTDEFQRLGAGVPWRLGGRCLGRVSGASLKAPGTEELMDLLDQDIGSNAHWSRRSGRRPRERPRPGAAATFKPADRRRDLVCQSLDVQEVSWGDVVGCDVAAVATAAQCHRRIETSRQSNRPVRRRRIDD